MKSVRIPKQKILLLAIAFLACQVFTFAQTTAKDVFGNSETQVLYLGIDFTKTKIIDDATANALDIRDRQYAAVNDLIINEAKKYDLKSAFHKSYIDHDLGLVSQMNSKINAEEIKSTSTADYHRLQPADIESVVRGYNFSGKKGVGLLFVAEAVSKSEKAIAVWVTLIDMNSRKILMTERMEGKVGGFGFRNYIAAGIKNILETIEKKKYEEWKKKYNN
jgi:hypothetical protein